MSGFVSLFLPWRTGLPPIRIYEPEKLQGKAPAVLSVNGHVGQPGKSIDYKQIRSINLAKRGMLVLSPEWFAMGELGVPGYGHDQIAFLDLTGRSGVALFYLALTGGLDVLLALLVADGGRAALKERAAELLDRGWLVLAADILFTGELRPAQLSVPELSMLIAAAGKRSLGEEAGQILVAARWAKERFGAPVTLLGSGPVAAVAVLLAGALDAGEPASARDIARVLAEGAPASLRDLIAGAVPYSKLPQLYCFGLLEAADLPELLELNHGRASLVAPTDRLPE